MPAVARGPALEPQVSKKEARVRCRRGGIRRAEPRCARNPYALKDAAVPRPASLDEKDTGPLVDRAAAFDWMPHPRPS
jgi:hypothetical protein